jgi:hypothetical protein
MYYVGCMMLRTGFYIMSCLTFQAKLLLYRHYVFVFDLFHILWKLFLSVKKAILYI